MGSIQLISLDFTIFNYVSYVFSFITLNYYMFHFNIIYLSLFQRTFTLLSWLDSNQHSFAFRQIVFHITHYKDIFLKNCFCKSNSSQPLRYCRKQPLWIFIYQIYHNPCKIIFLDFSHYKYNNFFINCKTFFFFFFVISVFNFNTTNITTYFLICNFFLFF